jgi:hypothetical protein
MVRVLVSRQLWFLICFVAGGILYGILFWCAWALCKPDHRASSTRQTLEEADGNNERTNLGFGRSLKRAWASSFRSIRSAPQLEGKREGDGGLYERDQLGGPVPGPHSRPASLEPSEWGSERSEWEFSGTERDTTKSDRLGPRAMFSAEYPAAAYSTGWS